MSETVKEQLQIDRYTMREREKKVRKRETEKDGNRKRERERDIYNLTRRETDLASAVYGRTHAVQSAVCVFVVAVVFVVAAATARVYSAQCRHVM